MSTAIADAVIVGAGAGARLGCDTPKAFVDLCGRPMLFYSAAVFSSHPSINKIILVVPPAMVDEAKSGAGRYGFADGRVIVAAGGAERWQSVRNGVSPSAAEWVLIHDAARPFVTREVIDSVIDMRGRFDCVITATPEVDTVRTFEGGGRCGVTVDRSKLLRVGTPQMFRREALMASFGLIEGAALPPTDEAALFEARGIPTGYSWGDPLNFKITTKADLEIARALIESGRLQPRGDNA